MRSILLSISFLFLFFQNSNAQMDGCATTPPDEESIAYLLKQIDLAANDDFSTESNHTCLPVKIHIVQNDDGDFGFNPSLLASAFASLNNAFIESGIQFFVCSDINYINNTDFFNYNTNAPDSDNEDDFLAGEFVSDAINLIITGSLTVTINGEPFVAAGFARYPANSHRGNRIFMDSQYMTGDPRGTLAHEFGHYLWLFHTHEGTEFGNDNTNAERVVRTGGNANCATTADLLCDTDADPRYNSSEFNSSNCTYTGTDTDDLGVPYLPTTAIENIMSYYPTGCNIGFSDGQYGRMNIGLNERLSHTVYNLNCPPSSVAAPSNLTLDTNIPGIISLSWSDNANNEMGYVIERSSTSSTSGFVPIASGGVAANVTTYSNFGIGNNTTYWYRVRPVNSACDNYSNVASNAPPSDCSENISGFSYLGEYGNSKYFLSNGTSRPTDAQVTAVSNNGYLVTINNAGENNFIQQNISEMVYIGLNDQDSEGNLEWFNGESLSYNNIDPCGFCNSNSANQDFVIMAPWNGTWSFSNFYNQRRYVMEVPCDGGGGGDQPDLTLENLDNVASSMTAGAVEFFEFDLKNIGTATAVSSYTIGMYISTDQNLSNDDIFSGEIGTANTFVGTDANVPAAITVPNVSDGTYYLIVKADIDNTISESNENNNTITSGAITIGSGGGGCSSSTNISGFSYLGEYGTSRYYLSNSNARPTDAQTTCTNNGGYLATIGSQGENNFIQQNISSMVYIGLNDQDVEGSLEWFNGEPVSYNNIDPCGFCNSNSGNQDFVIIAPWNGTWSFSNFYNQRKYIMEIPCGSDLNFNNNAFAIPDSPKEQFDFVGIVPNPADQFIELKFNSTFEKEISIQIFDSRGALVQQVQQLLFEGLNGVEINIDHLANGMYWIKIPEMQTNKTIKRFVKVR